MTDPTNEMLERAGALEDMTRSRGWEYTRRFISEYVQALTDRLVTEGFTTVEEYQFYRGQIAGLRLVLTEIDAQLTNLSQWRERGTEG